ncbi:T9SS type A sorting domain-containing protein [Proteiniphilum sp.]|uniref:T9SS type A sorting domain-containing protein n=1 Tax=Proteiniphilum sp. TaxID=1926877 RepID=UPI002B1E9702|nr:T9SS type A sorting domain-containing protein [Proteiniphilum sp.]MEA4916750.1 T9SS type A sorting domain-containing protein [Proteiniphilum sp.]
MRKILLLIALAFCFQTQLKAVPAYPYPIEIIQPDGSSLTIMLKEDEYYSWTETTDVVSVELKVKQQQDSTAVPQNMTSARISGMYEIQLWSSASLLKTDKTDQPKYQISVSGLPAGIYFIRVIKDGKTYTKKLIKR